MKKKTAIWIKIIVLGILTLALIGILIVGILGNTFRTFRYLALFPAMTMPICIRWEMLIFLHPNYPVFPSTG